MERRDKCNYYLDIAETVMERGTCLRRNYGSIIVKNDEIIFTGYTGAPRNRKNCIDLGFCRRQQLNIPRGERYELCTCPHRKYRFRTGERGRGPKVLPPLRKQRRGRKGYLSRRGAA